MALRLLAFLSFVYTLADFNYHLPEHLIAQHPVEPRSASRLLRVQCHADALGSPSLSHHVFSDFVQLVHANDLLVFNNTKVLKARLFGKKATGGKVEILVERIQDDHHALAHVRASKSPTANSSIILENSGCTIQVLGRENDLFRLQFPENIWQYLEEHGQTPLPPYISHQPDQYDDQRYQTVFAQIDGAIAAPTAGLHFDAPIFEALAQKGVAHTFVTLHVGAGTFLPVRVDNIADHQMHSEAYSISTEAIEAIEACKARGGRVIAIGTTAVRALESAAQNRMPLQAHQKDTQIFITPGFRFQVVDALLTNFHLPQSTLLMLIAALAGIENIQAAYAQAIAQEYRFFSYGDAMFLEPPSVDPS